MYPPEQMSRQFRFPIANKSSIRTSIAGHRFCGPRFRDFYCVLVQRPEFWEQIDISRVLVYKKHHQIARSEREGVFSDGQAQSSLAELVARPIKFGFSTGFPGGPGEGALDLRRKCAPLVFAPKLRKYSKN